MSKTSEERNREYNEMYERMRRRDVHSGAPLPGHPDYRSPESQYSSPGCFATGTNISTPSGLRCIEHIEAGDLVWSVGPDGSREARPVLCRKDHPAEQVWELVFEDGSSLKTTPIHSFSKNGKWVKAARLKPGDQIEAVSDTGESILRVVRHSGYISETSTVHNLIVADTFTFVADGALAHSFSYFRSVRCLLWTAYGWCQKMPASRKLELANLPTTK